MKRFSDSPQHLHFPLIVDSRRNISFHLLVQENSIEATLKLADDYVVELKTFPKVLIVIFFEGLRYYREERKK
jgi:hypothetical protein